MINHVIRINNIILMQFNKVIFDLLMMTDLLLVSFFYTFNFATDTSDTLVLRNFETSKKPVSDDFVSVNNFSML